MYHLTPVAYTMDSWIEVRKWIMLSMVSPGKKGFNNGSMFQDEECNTLTIVALDLIFHEVL